MLDTNGKDNRRRRPKHTFSKVRREMESVLSLKLTNRLIWAMNLTVRAEIERRQKELEKVLLEKFLRDEMSKEINILKLRKLALCRLGAPGYRDYREKYFDGVSNA